MGSEHKICGELRRVSCPQCHSYPFMAVCKKPEILKLSAQSYCSCTRGKEYGPEYQAIGVCQSACCLKILDNLNPISGVEPCACPETAQPIITCTEEEENTEDIDEPGGAVPCCVRDPQDDCCSASCSDLCNTARAPDTTKKPLYIEPRNLNSDPKSVEELKESISGLPRLPNYRGALRCFNMELRSDTNHPDQCDPECSGAPALEQQASQELYFEQNEQTGPSDSKPRRQGLSLTMEPKDHKFCVNPNDCRHSRESLHLTPENTDLAGAADCQITECPVEPPEDKSCQTPSCEGVCQPNIYKGC